MTATTKTNEASPAYWLNGTAYCPECVEDTTAPAMSAEEAERATRAPGAGRCGCCKTPFAAD